VVLYGAYTGKAAHVLRQKGCVGASTIHSLIYIAREKSRDRLRDLERELVARLAQLRGEDPEAKTAEDSEVQRIEALLQEERDILSQPAFRLNPESYLRDADLLVVDECSMVDGQMGEDLLSFGVPVLVLGDPAQLPPVGGGGLFTAREPNVMLTEIHRQARDNPIVALATDVRNGKGLIAGFYGTSSVIHRSELEEEVVLAHDQILVGRNKTRHACNARARELSGLGEDWTPVPGDKLVCLRNDHEQGLLNGSLWSATDIGGVDDDRVIMTIESLDGVGEGQVTVEAWGNHFRGEEFSLPWWERKEASEFAFGYALTVHKAQGSQWDSVLLFDESGVFRGEAARWLYTGITRAAEKITIVRGR
jgi:exodeoxyribonuclease-5